MVLVCRDQGLKYNVTAGDEVEDMFALLSEVKRKIPSISAVSSGAIASDYQRLRVESVCSRLGLISLAYLWKQDQTLLLEEMVPLKPFYFLFLLVVCTSRKNRTRNLH
jgi:diphthine-ammonia ligase